MQRKINKYKFVFMRDFATERNYGIMELTTEDIIKMLESIRLRAPLVHCITNYVTANDAANALLAVGASPIMADDIREAGDISAVSSALVINMGALNERTAASMFEAGKRANEHGVPVVFDPVGVGASALRGKTAEKIMSHIKLSVLRGNLSEISFVAGLSTYAKGVDSSEDDDCRNAETAAVYAANQLGCCAAITGAVDTISDGKRTIQLLNGHKMLSSVTGTGCMTSALTGAFAGVCKGDFFTAAAGGVLSMGLAGEIAYENAGSIGAGSFHIAIIDALSNLDAKTIAERAKINEK